MEMKVRVFKSLKEGLKKIDPQTLAGISIDSAGKLKVMDVDFKKITTITKINSPEIVYDENEVWIGSIQINRGIKIIELYGNNSLAHKNAVILANEMAKMMWMNKIANGFFPIHPNYSLNILMQHKGKIEKISVDVGNLRIVEDHGIVCTCKNNLYRYSIDDQNLKLIWTNKNEIKFLGRPNKNRIPITFVDGESSVITVMLNQSKKGILSTFISRKIPIIKTDEYVGDIHMSGISIAVSKERNEIIFYPVSF